MVNIDPVAGSARSVFSVPNWFPRRQLTDTQWRDVRKKRRRGFFNVKGQFQGAGGSKILNVKKHKILAVNSNVSSQHFLPSLRKPFGLVLTLIYRYRTLTIDS
jgi:hypothetical protein